MNAKEQIHELSEEMLENLGKLVAIDSKKDEPKPGKPFGLRLMAGLMEAFAKEENRDALLAATTPADLWKAFMRTTRYTIR